jgi:hypothetical protein
MGLISLCSADDSPGAELVVSQRRQIPYRRPITSARLGRGLLAPDQWSLRARRGSAARMDRIEWPEEKRRNAMRLIQITAVVAFMLATASASAQTTYYVDGT